MCMVDIKMADLSYAPLIVASNDRLKHCFINTSIIDVEFAKFLTIHIIQMS